MSVCQHSRSNVKQNYKVYTNVMWTEFALLLVTPYMNVHTVLVTKPLNHINRFWFVIRAIGKKLVCHFNQHATRFPRRKIISRYRLNNGDHFVSMSMCWRLRARSPGAILDCLHSIRTNMFKHGVGIMWRTVFGIVTQRLLNSSHPEQNGRHFADDIFKRISLNEKIEFWLQFHWNLFLRVQLTIIQYWFR